MKKDFSAFIRAICVIRCSPFKALIFHFDIKFYSLRLCPLRLIFFLSVPVLLFNNSSN
jgi:hypothetical protein